MHIRRSRTEDSSLALAPLHQGWCCVARYIKGGDVEPHFVRIRLLILIHISLTPSPIHHGARTCAMLTTAGCITPIQETGCTV